MKTTRIYQVTALVLMVVSVVQVGWWIIDEYGFIKEKTTELNSLYAQEAQAAQVLLDSGTAPDKVMRILPNVTVVDGTASVRAKVQQDFLEEHNSRIKRFEWESGFFLLALFVCMAVIWRALRAEARVLVEQDHFLAMVSHQFKTPLASLQLSLETISMRALSAEQLRPLIERMLADVSRMETLVTRILDSVRLERGRVDLKREAIDLGAAVARVVGQVEERARKDRITITTDVPRGLEALADPMAMDVVIRNLVENAIAAVAPVGGGTVALTARRLNGEIELAVKDSGVGFRPADGAQLFKKFSRLQGGSSSYYGTGLGLFIVRRMMQLAGGRVSAHSDGVGQGAQFVLAWPVAPLETR